MTPDNIPLPIAIPLIIVLWAFVIIMAIANHRKSR